MEEKTAISGIAQSGPASRDVAPGVRLHAPMRDPDFEAPFAFDATHIVAPRGAWIDHPDARAVMFIDRWGYTQDAWEQGTPPPFVWSWSGCRSQAGAPFAPHPKYPHSHRRLGLDTELRPRIDRYRDLLPHEKESRPPFFATHRLPASGAEVMVIEGRGYTDREWASGRPPAFLADGRGALYEFPDGRDLPFGVEVRALPVRLGAWWAAETNVGRTALVTPQGVVAAPWQWRRHRFTLEPDRAGRQMLAQHLLGLRGERVAAPRELNWIAHRCRDAALRGGGAGSPLAWAVDTATVDAWRREVSETPLLGELAETAFPWVPTHACVVRHWTFGEERWDVMVIGHTAFTQTGWGRGGDPICVTDGQNEWLSTEFGLTPEMEPIGEARAVGWSDPDTSARYAYLIGAAGVEALQVDGGRVDWLTHSGRQALARALVKAWPDIAPYGDALAARLGVETWLSQCHDVAWSAGRSEVGAALGGDRLRAGTPVPPPLDRGDLPAAPLAHPPMAPPSIGPVL